MVKTTQAGVLLLALTVMQTVAQEGGRFDATIIDESPFAGFKQNVIETECVVERLGEFPSYGNTNIGAEGGAELSDEEALAAYECAQPAMRENYARSGVAAAADYLDWQRFSIVPYVSRAHSKRYVSNYANKIAAEHYALYEDVDQMPVGSWLAKDSLVVTEEGRVEFGALSLMEKMPPGFNPDTGDWRFSLILPDGRLFGSTNTVDQVTVKFCAECHQDAGPQQDYMFFMPKRYRLTQ